MADLKTLLEIALGQKINAIRYENGGMHLLMLDTDFSDVKNMCEHLSALIEKCEIKNEIIIKNGTEKEKKEKKNRKRQYTEYIPIDNEVWRDIKGCSGFKVSNIGRVMEHDKILMPVESEKGYLLVSVKEDNKVRKYKRVHRLVAEAFIDNPMQKPEVDHINTDKKDNRVENLRWVTHFENIFENETTLDKLKDMPVLFRKKVYETIDKEKEYLNSLKH